jgi:glycosyltransferase involved in cell wall biosynthesis
VDVTDLLGWQGGPTGIPRVVAGLGSRFMDDPAARFFSYQHGSRQFAETPRERVRRQFRRFADVRSPTSSVEPVAGSRRLTLIARERLRRLPAPIRHGIRRIDDRARSLAQGALSTQRVLGHPGLLSQPGPGHPVSFERGDRVIVLGHGWMEASLQSELGLRKLEIGIDVYQVLYDLSPLEVPQAFGPGFSDQYARYLFEALSISDGIVAISAHTRADALRFCDELLLPRPRIGVLRLADEPGQVEPKSVNQLANDPFVLSVGTQELRKNHTLLYQAWRLAKERGVVLPRLAIVGRPGWGSSDIRYAMAHDPMIKHSILMLDSVTDPELEWLYRHCQMTIYPSLYEGWGLPIAESLAHGKVCIASDASAMPEVAGGLIDYFSPFSADDLLARLIASLDPARLAQKEAEIRRAYRQTSWNDTYADLLRTIGTMGGDSDTASH